MSQIYEIGEINPTTTSPLTDISKLTRALDSLHSLFSGPSSPQITVPYMFWADTTEGILKRRNANNDSWIFALSLTEDFIKVITATYTTEVTDAGNMLLVDASSSSIIINLVPASSARTGSTISIKKTDSTTNKVIITPNASETIDGFSDYQLQVAGETIILRSTGSNWIIVNLYLPIVVLSKTADYTAVRADDRTLLAVSASTASNTVTLPAVASINNGFTLTIKKTDSSTNTVTINGNVNETIDGALTKVLSKQNQSISIVSNRIEWFVISEASTSRFATNTEMVAATNNDIGVTPANINFSPSAVQVQLRYQLSTSTTFFSRNVDNVLNTTGDTIQVFFDVEFASIDGNPQYIATVGSQKTSTFLDRSDVVTILEPTTTSIKLVGYSIGFGAWGRTGNLISSLSITGTIVT